MVGPAALSWLLFAAVLVNQIGRVMVPSVMTSVLADKDFDVTAESRGFMLAVVSAVCLGGKFLGAAVTDKLGGWFMLILVFAGYGVSSLGLVLTSSPTTFAVMWWVNSLAYTIAWGAACQVIGASYSAADRPVQLTRIASASRFGATLGSMVFGSLLKAGMTWRRTLLPAIPIQLLLSAVCTYLWLSSKPSVAAVEGGEKTGATKAPEPSPSEAASPWRHVTSLNFWLMFIPKVVLFTYTQFFMNFVGPLLHSNYGFDHGDATSLAGLGQGGSVLGLLVVGDMVYKKLTPTQKQKMVLGLLAICIVVPFTLAFAKRLPFDISILAVPLLFLWSLAYALPFYLPPGEFALRIGGKSASALFTNLFDAGGFTLCFFWNSWASRATKEGNFEAVLVSQAVFGVISFVCMPLCLYRLEASVADKKKD
ncbi:hypothetical protein AB1Y20_019370 [Prymnesium parvum]|uniref:Major facilitator superfamily (MFS) profile domain-containing protein n=1 Tax=Prymnesium parvum TaxID=97485 RepID=A0AB34JUV3_PRYPA